MDLVRHQGFLAAQRLRMDTARTNRTTTATGHDKTAPARSKTLLPALAGGRSVGGNAWLYHDGSIPMYPLASVAPDKPSLSGSSVVVTVLLLSCSLSFLYSICSVTWKQALKATGLESVTLCILSY